MWNLCYQMIFILAFFQLRRGCGTGFNVLSSWTIFTWSHSVQFYLRKEGSHKNPPSNINYKAFLLFTQYVSRFQSELRHCLTLWREAKVVFSFLFLEVWCSQIPRASQTLCFSLFEFNLMLASGSQCRRSEKKTKKLFCKAFIWLSRRFQGRRFLSQISPNERHINFWCLNSTAGWTDIHKSPDY